MKKVRISNDKESKTRKVRNNERISARDKFSAYVDWGRCDMLISFQCLGAFYVTCIVASIDKNRKYVDKNYVLRLVSGKYSALRSYENVTFLNA